MSTYDIKESGGDLRLYQDGKDIGRATDYPVAVQFWRESTMLREILTEALPWVEAQLDDPVNKPGAVRAVSNRMRLAIGS